MNNTLGDLNNFLFSQLERLDNEELSKEELEKEISRGKAITNVATAIINNANTVIKAKELQDNRMDADSKMPKMLQGE